MRSLDVRVQWGEQRDSLLLGEPVRQAPEAVIRGVASHEQGLEAFEGNKVHFRRLVESLADVVFRYELKPRPRLGYVSPAIMRLTGHSPEEFYSDPELLFSVVHADDLESFRAILEDKSFQETPVVRWRHKDGRVTWVELHCLSIYDEKEQCVATEGAGRDVTRQRQIEEQLARAQRLAMAGRIAGQAAHDVGNLVGKLMGYPELIKETLPEDHEAVAFCDAMVRSAELIADINSDMLALSRRGLLDQRPIDLNRLAKQAMELLSNAPDALAVRLDLDPNIAPVSGSSVQLWRVLSNLIVNARDAMRDSGELRIRTENVYVDQPFCCYNVVEVGEYVRLSVSDTGCGIPTEIQNRIFEAFFTTKRDTLKSGSGLGLSVVRAIVEDHKGYIDLESEVGKGSTFSIYLPTQTRAPQRAIRGEERTDG